MIANEIDSYEKLEKFLRLELARQTQKAHTMEVELPEVWFFKLAKLICFALRDDPNERWVARGLGEDCQKYVVKMNRIFTVVKREKTTKTDD